MSLHKCCMLPLRNEYVGEISISSVTGLSVVAIKSLTSTCSSLFLLSHKASLLSFHGSVPAKATVCHTEFVRSSNGSGVATSHVPETGVCQSATKLLGRRVQALKNNFSASRVDDNLQFNLRDSTSFIIKHLRYGFESFTVCPSFF